MINNFGAIRRIKMTAPETIDNFGSFLLAYNQEYENFKKEMRNASFSKKYCSTIATLEKMHRNKNKTFTVPELVKCADYVTEFISRVFEHQLATGQTDIVKKWADREIEGLKIMSQLHDINETSIANCLAIYQVLQDSPMANDTEIKQIIDSIQQFCQDSKIFKVLF